MSDIDDISSCQILGIRFFNGDVDEAVASMFRQGGFLVAPSGTCFARLREDETYRHAVVGADLAIADSGLMVVLWRLLRREKVHRISGFKYLKHLVVKLKGEGNATVFWVLPSESARQKLLDWSSRERFSIKRENCYVAPRYGSEVEDRNLLSLIEQQRPAHVIIAIGSGDPLHRRCARIPHGRSGSDSRMGGPVLSRLALPVGCATARFHPATVPRGGTSVVNLEIWRETAAAALVRTRGRLNEQSH